MSSISRVLKYSNARFFVEASGSPAARGVCLDNLSLGMGRCIGVWCLDNLSLGRLIGVWVAAVGHVALLI